MSDNSVVKVSYLLTFKKESFDFNALMGLIFVKSNLKLFLLLLLLYQKLSLFSIRQAILFSYKNPVLSFF